MTARRQFRFFVLLLCMAAVPYLVPLQAAHAQLSAGAGSGGPGGGGGGDDSQDEAEAKAAAAAAAPPPALPGAVPNDQAVPSSHAALDMNPTAALFDSIDRGDLTAAKDALSRGADLQGTNVLGEKPIEMAIDLNRNDITFLLLSMRDEDATESGSELQAQATTSSSVSGAARNHVAIEARAARSPIEEAAFRRSQSGGDPKPSIGFLGFNGS